jgi:flavin-dependent dehydrogenase
VKKHYDVIICGGGLAGLTTARQLKRRFSQLSVCVLERSGEEPPEGTFKVGESCVEGSTHWLEKTLGLKDYLDERHLKKFGLRFFGAGGQRPFEERLELGPVDFPPIDSVQLDRGRLENDLRRMIITDGCDVRSGCRVTEFNLDIGDVHHVKFTDIKNGDASALTCRWLIDATGRKRMVANQLDLKKRSTHRASASWFRVDGRLTVDDLVPKSDREWHERSIRDRWYSTNHLFGHGYWVWLIPLSSNKTSIGVVADQNIHPICNRSKLSTTLDFLSKHEPILAKKIEGHEVLDFRLVKHFAHTSEQVFSSNRWACVGESAAFPDPLYSIGSDLIAWASSSVCTLIEHDLAGKLTPELVSLYDRVFREQNDWVTGWMRDMYQTYGNDGVLLPKLLWDGLSYFMAPVRILQHEFLRNPKAIERYDAAMQRQYELDEQVQKMFRDWNATGLQKIAHRGHYPPGFFFPSMAKLADIGVSFSKGVSFLNELPKYIDQMEQLANALGEIGHTIYGVANPFEEATAQVRDEVSSYLHAAGIFNTELGKTA